MNNLKEKLKSMEKELANACNDNQLLVDLSTKCLKCNEDVKQNELCLLDLQLNYFEKCSSYVTSACDLMVEDQQHYGMEFDQSTGNLSFILNGTNTFTSFFLNL